jgi:hypothetical protein
MMADGNVKGDIDLYGHLLSESCWMVIDDYYSPAPGSKDVLIRPQVDALVDAGRLEMLGFYGWSTWIGRWRGTPAHNPAISGAFEADAARTHDCLHDEQRGAVGGAAWAALSQFRPPGPLSAFPGKDDRVRDTERHRGVAPALNSRGRRYSRFDRCSGRTHSPHHWSQIDG